MWASGQYPLFQLSDISTGDLIGGSIKANTSPACTAGLISTDTNPVVCQDLSCYVDVGVSNVGSGMGESNHGRTAKQLGAVMT